MNSSRFPSGHALFLLLVVVLGWGLSWTVIKHALAEIPPLSFRGSSAVAGGLCMLVLARLQGKVLCIARVHWRRFAVLALFNITLWNVFATYGMLFLSSGQAALLAYTMPVMCVPLSILLLKEPFTLQRGIAVLLGFGGVLVLRGEGAQGLLQAPAGVMLMLAGAAIWALGLVLFKRWSLPVDSSVLTGWMLLLGGLPMLVAAFWVDGLPQRMPGSGGLFGLGYSVIVTFMLCYWAWNRFVALVPVSVSSISSLLTPLVGVASGAVFLGEHPGWPEAIAALLILGAVAVVNVRPRANA